MSNEDDDYLSDKFLVAPESTTQPKTYGQRRREAVVRRFPVGTKRWVLLAGRSFADAAKSPRSDTRRWRSSRVALQHWTPRPSPPKIAGMVHMDFFLSLARYGGDEFAS